MENSPGIVLMNWHSDVVVCGSINRVFETSLLCISRHFVWLMSVFSAESAHTLALYRDLHDFLLAYDWMHHFHIWSQKETLTTWLIDLQNRSIYDIRAKQSNQAIAIAQNQSSNSCATEADVIHSEGNLKQRGESYRWE